MTPEQAQYYLLMLRMGEYDEYDAFLDRLLLEQDPLSPLVLELAFCMSDREQTISVLHNFLLDHPADDSQVCGRLLRDMARCWRDRSMSAEEISDFLYRCALNSGQDHWEDPWYRLYDFTYALEEYEDGWITREVFLADFEKRLSVPQP